MRAAGIVVPPASRSGGKRCQASLQLRTTTIVPSADSKRVIASGSAAPAGGSAASGRRAPSARPYAALRARPETDASSRVA